MTPQRNKMPSMFLDHHHFFFLLLLLPPPLAGFSLLSSVVFGPPAPLPPSSFLAGFPIFHSPLTVLLLYVCSPGPFQNPPSKFPICLSVPTVSIPHPCALPSFQPPSIRRPSLYVPMP